MAVTDPSASDPSLDDLVGAVLAQAVEIAALDGPRAEAWAGDILALAVETVGGDDPVAALVGALSAAGGDASATALCALGAFVSDLPVLHWAGPAPVWAEAMGTSVCEGAWLLETRGAVSAAFRFVDSLDVRHVVTVDLVGGAPGELGEVVLGPGDLLDALDEDDADVSAAAVPAAELAARAAAALRATERPRESAVVNGRLLVARLASIIGEVLTPPVGVVDEVPDLPTRDPEDDAFALEVLDRALGRPDPVADLTELAALVRETAADDDELADWTAAAGCSLKDVDEAVALAPIVATVAPSDLGPLDPTRRDAVLALEWADWLGAVIGLVRSGGGAVVNGESMVDAVNRCPEVTSTIPKQDRARIAWAFDVLTEYWEPLGLTADGALTARGVAVLPAALRWAWSR